MRDLPFSNRIEPYLEAIADCDAFFVAERDYGRIINYRRMGADVFPDPFHAPDAHTAYLWGLRRQCRGLVFDLSGLLVSPGFEKFFNVSENAETQVDCVDLSQPHVIMEKLDGCLTGDTKVTTPYGQMTMAEICASDQHTPVLAYDHELDREVWAEVMGTSVKESADNWYQITLDDGQTLNLTDNHKVWCVNKNQYLTVADLDEGDEVRLQED